MRVTRTLGITLLVLGAGCSDSSPADTSSSLDCAWLAGDNCLKTNLMDAASCLAPSTETGVLSADNLSCSYASGTVVTFDAPLTLPIPLNPPPGWHFTVTRAGAPCLRFESSDNDNFKLVVGGKAVTQTLPRPASTPLTITCPDGTARASSSPLSLLMCTSGGLVSESFASTDTSVSLTILLFGSSTPPLSMFQCAR